MNSRSGRVLKVIVAAVITMAVIALAVWGMWLRGSPPTTAATAPTASTATPGPAPKPAQAGPVHPAASPIPVVVVDDRPSSGSTTRTAATTPSTAPGLTASTLPASTQPALTPLTREEGKRAYDEGMGLLKDGKLLPARAALSKAIFSGQLTPPEETQAVKELTDLANRTILGRELLEGDPYNTFYTVRSGDTLEGPRGIEMTQGLHVPASLILRVNGLARGADMRPGKTIKLVKGPFNVIVYKSRFIMDVYLQRELLERVFVRRIPVGLGRNDSTPVGAWRVKKGDKMAQPAWDPPPASGMSKRILYGEPGYPFGKKALWIGLEGMEPQTAAVDAFGIHSTNDPNSIGKANSLGCVRMADDDIDLVFSLLYDVHSRVDVVP
jgi:hypothetical protein